MGSRLHGNDGSTHIVIPATAGIHGVGSRSSSFPRRRESTAWGACDGFPSTRERGRNRAAGILTTVPVSTANAAHIVIPATAGIHGGGDRDGFGGNDGSTHIVIAATAGIHGVGSLRWVPVSTGTTVGGGAPHTVGGAHIVIPATAGIHGGGSLRWVPVSTGTTVATHIVIPATAGIHGGRAHIVIPVDTGTTG